MAFENLQPFRDEILALRHPGPNQKTLTEVAEYLFDKHGLRTTPATLSRYLKELRQPVGIALRDATEQERAAFDTVAILTELMAEIRGRSDEQRVAIEHLAGQIAVQSRSIEELESKITQNPASAAPINPALLRRIWLRAFIISFVIAALIATGSAYLLVR
ncbi:MAG: hypothetical protein KDJ29_20740 [Hyphomicrobiales bacterium]|nr:hypothetical protein [Hyphomicrobiales bacterium]